MKSLKHILLIFCTIATLSCSSNSDDADENPSSVNGTITLSGDDTSEIGTSLSVGNVYLGSQSTGTDQSVTLSHQNLKFNNNGVPSYTDINNTFVIVTAQFSTGEASVSTTVSMAINVNGVEYKYACTYPSIGTFISCGDGFSVDKNGKKVIFDNTTVINTDTESILTLNGTVTW